MLAAGSWRGAAIAVVQRSGCVVIAEHLTRLRFQRCAACVVRVVLALLASVLRAASSGFSRSVGRDCAGDS